MDVDWLIWHNGDNIELSSGAQICLRGKDNHGIQHRHSLYLEIDDKANEFFCIRFFY